MKKKNKKVGRRDFLKKGCELATSAAFFLAVLPVVSPKNLLASTGSIAQKNGQGYDWEDHLYAYLVDTKKCIGCGLCVESCRIENHVPEGFFRTWVERYEISERGEVYVDSPKGGQDGFEPIEPGFRSSKAFFVPKMCNQCANTPCTQVCPVGASYTTKDGVVMVDAKHCIGCGYCVQACPYGSRYINPNTGTADKCTWCYHRITKGLQPACVQACPVNARRFGDLKKEDDEVRKILSTERIEALQIDKLTQPRCFYLGLDMEVR